MTALLDKALEIIRSRRGDFEKKYGIRLVGIVGSVARGEERTDSDVDVVFDVASMPTLFDLAHAQFQLEELLGRAVDLVNREALRPKARAYIERDLVVA
ncbi:MAG: nucleotidyltransferase family protein [Pseudomonadota bacterium]